MSEPDLYIGVLSGTSIDGVDAAIVRFTPQPVLVGTHSLAFPSGLREELRALCVPGEGEIDRMGRADVEVGRLFARAVVELLERSSLRPAEIRCIGSHGQTIRHRPRFSPAFTLQIGDPNVIAAITGIPVAADFRRKDMALGGEGAPLVPAFHEAAFRVGTEDRIVVNIGGIANVTVLPRAGTAPVLGFDTGPGNTLLDAWSRHALGEPMDLDGAFAASGQAHPTLLHALLADPYFLQPRPKSTGPEYFSMEWLQRHLDAARPLADADVQATLLALTTHTIADAIRRFAGPEGQDVFVCGGGAHNGALMRLLQEQLPDCAIGRTDALGVAVDWVEAMAFAWLARQRWNSAPGNCPAVTGAERTAVLGGLFLPG